ncbi:hypothetical protein GCM10009092_10700 [Bowmanella denitrificans]|uniref:Uncharacterized protein n=1 Tax=Bowmanella denitrificans TaxID=366582 RepID=A0ABP3GL07_9ALTE
MSNEQTALLERLVQVNEQILEKLFDIQNELSTITNELDWTKEHSHSKMQLEWLEEIDTKLYEISLSLGD